MSEKFLCMNMSFAFSRFHNRVFLLEVVLHERGLRIYRNLRMNALPIITEFLVPDLL